jgi:hypothetical protein
MRFKEWIMKNFPSFEDKMNACYSEIESAAFVVDIDFRGSDLAEGVNKGSSVKTNTNKSKGRCRVYINRKEYDGMFFPHLVFLNLRHSFQDSVTGKATPSVVNTVNILFEIFQEKKEINYISLPEKKISTKKKTVSREILVNEQRQWFSKLGTYSNQKYSAYFENKNISPLDIKNLDVDIRIGFNRRYGRFAAIPLRYPHQDSFEGFQRIFDTGEKIMLKDFNPNGLCAYFSPLELRECSEIDLIISHEGVANALVSAIMCHELNIPAVNVAGLYEANLPIVTRIITDEVKPKRFINIYDNDQNEVGLTTAKKCQIINPLLEIATTTRNDLCETVKDYSYKYALAEFKNILSIVK